MQYRSRNSSILSWMAVRRRSSGPYDDGGGTQRRSQRRRSSGRRRSSILGRYANRKSIMMETTWKFEMWKAQITASQHTSHESNTTHEPVGFVRGWCKGAAKSPLFSLVIMSTIVVNAVVIAVETDVNLVRQKRVLFEVLNAIFFAVYAIEFVIKIISDPIGYWKSKSNLFDFWLLLTSVPALIGTNLIADTNVLRLGRTFRALRVLRSISFIRSLRVIVGALVKTISSILNLIVLLLLLMYVFATVGYYLFGYDDDLDIQAKNSNWGSLDRAMLSLFTLVTADGWTDIQDDLDERGYRSSRIFTATFLFLGHFVFTNLFIGVVIQNLEEATLEERAIEQAKRTVLFLKKKEFILQLQRSKAMAELCKESIPPTAQCDTGPALLKLVNKATRDGLIHIQGGMFQAKWIQQYLASLDVQSDCIYATQQCHWKAADAIIAAATTNEHSDSVAGAPHAYSTSVKGLVQPEATDPKSTLNPD